jgi:hypothetical protein
MTNDLFIFGKILQPENKEKTPCDDMYKGF